MTLADYSLSGVVFDGLDHWKNVLAEVSTVSSNNTESLAQVVQLLEEFIHIARSELAAPYWLLAVLASCAS